MLYASQVQLYPAYVLSIVVKAQHFLLFNQPHFDMSLGLNLKLEVWIQRFPKASIAKRKKEKETLA